MRERREFLIEPLEGLVLQVQLRGILLQLVLRILELRQVAGHF